MVELVALLGEHWLWEAMKEGNAITSRRVPGVEKGMWKMGRRGEGLRVAESMVASGAVEAVRKMAEERGWVWRKE